MKKKLTLPKFIQNFNLKFDKISDFNILKNKRYAINFTQNFAMFALAILLFSILTRPLALDMAELQGMGEAAGTIETAEVFEASDTPKETENENNPFPFELRKPLEEPGRRLTRAEMRWIFKEEIRLNAMKQVINDGNERAHRAYSAIVGDFNIRGANYKYELRDRTKAKEDIEAFREEIENQAKEEARENGWGKL